MRISDMKNLEEFNAWCEQARRTAVILAGMLFLIPNQAKVMLGVMLISINSDPDEESEQVSIMLLHNMYEKLRENAKKAKEDQASDVVAKAMSSILDNLQGDDQP